MLVERLIPVSLLAASVCFGLGICLPIVHFEKFYFFTETPSLIELMTGLWASKNYWISAAIGLFSILFPLVKLTTVFFSAFAGSIKPVPRWSVHLAKWSMMDVLIVALVIFAAKTTGVANAIVQPGLWFYGASTVLVTIAAECLSRFRPELVHPTDG
ncbi:MAG: paraquat-inducible protein A [Pseudomonadota bacterium]